MGASGAVGADEARRHRENMKRGGISAWRQKGGMSSWRGGRTWRKRRKIRQALFGLPRQCRCVLSDPPAVADRRFRCAESAGSRKGFSDFWGERQRRMGHMAFSPFFMSFGVERVSFVGLSCLSSAFQKGRDWLCWSQAPSGGTMGTALQGVGHVVTESVERY